MKVKGKQSKKIIIALLAILIIILAGVGSVGILSKTTNNNLQSDKQLRKQLADASVTEIELSGAVGVTEPMEVNGAKKITGKGSLCAANGYEATDIDALLVLNDKADVSLGGNVTIDASSVDCAIYVSKNASLTIGEETLISNAKAANIYSLGEVLQTGGTLEKGHDNVYIAKGGHFLWEAGSNLSSVNHGVHIEEGATLKATSENASMREAGSHGIFLQGTAEINDILIVKSDGNQIDVGENATLTINGGDIAYGNYNGVNNRGTLVMNGGSIYNSAYSGIVNSGETELKAGSLLNNSDKGILNRNGGKLTIVSKDMTIGSNAYGIGNEENAVCELANAAIRANKTNNIINFGYMNIHDVTIENSGSNSINSNFGGVTILKNVIIDGTGKNHGIYCEHNSVVELENVTIKNITQRGIHNLNGEIKGKNVIFENVGTACISSAAHKRLGSGTITLENVKTVDAGSNSLYLDGAGAGIVHITNSVFGATGSNNISIKMGEAHLTNVEIQGNTEGSGESAHGIYATGGKLYMTDCTISGATGSAVRNNGGYIEIKQLKVANNKVHNIFASKGTTILKTSTLAASGYHHVYCKGGTVTLDDCVLKKGAVSCLSVTDEGKVTAQDAIFEATSGNNLTITGGSVILGNTSVLGNLAECNDSTHGVYIKAGKISLKNSSIGCTTGSAIRNSGGIVEATDLSVNDIKVHNIFASDGSTVVKDSVLSAPDYHHVYCKGGEVTVKSCTLEEGAQSTLSVPTGGVVKVENSKLGATSQNNITITGGAVRVEKSKILGNLSDCSASTHGVYLTAGNISVENSTITHTTGNAIRTKGGDVNVDGLQVSNIGITEVGSHVITTAASDSGVCGKVIVSGLLLGENCLTTNSRYALYSENDGCYSEIGYSSLTAGKDNTLICNNNGTIVLQEGLELYGAGRAVYNRGIMIMNGGKIHDNGDETQGAADGTAIVNIGDLTINGGEIYNNYTRTWAAINNTKSKTYVGTLIINGGKVYNNTSAHHGGGVSILNGTQGVIAGAEFYNNKAAQSGGAVYVGKNSTLSVSDSKFHNNIGTGKDIMLVGFDPNSSLSSQLTLKGKIEAEEINSAQKNAYVSIQGVLSNGSSIMLNVPNTTGSIVVKSENADVMSANMAYLKLVKALVSESLGLKLDSEHPEQALLATDTTPSVCASIGENEYYSLQEAVNAAANATDNKVIIEIIKRIYLTDTITIPDGYDITIQDNGTKRTISRSSTWAENTTMFSLGSGSKLSFVSTGTDAEPKLVIDGNKANTTAGTVTRLVSIPTGTTVNVGAGVQISNHKTHDEKNNKNGGAISVDGGILNITGGVLNDNEGARGGAVNVTVSNSVVNITGGTFSNNKATVVHGGAINVLSGLTGCTFTVRGANFTSNTATNQGGAIYFDNSTMDASIENCTFTSNTAQYGGAIVNNIQKKAGDKKVILTGNTFTGNTGTKGGGVLSTGKNTITVFDDNVFSGNSGSTQGADVRVGDETSEIKLSGANSFEAYLYKKAYLYLNEDFAASSQITIICNNDKSEGDVIVQCAKANVATASVNCFTLSGTKLNGFVLTVDGTNLKLKKANGISLGISLLANMLSELLSNQEL